MPTYHAAGVAARLTSRPFTLPTTTKSLIHDNTSTKTDIHHAGGVLEDTGTLEEFDVEWSAGENGERKGGGSAGRLGFIGRWGDVPFLCVGVDAGGSCDHVVDKIIKEEEVQGKHPDAVMLGDGLNGEWDESGTPLSDFTSLGSTPQRSQDGNEVVMGEGNYTTTSRVDLNDNTLKDAIHWGRNITRHAKQEDVKDTDMSDVLDSSILLTNNETSASTFHALTLAIDLSEKSFNRSSDPQCSGQDIKMEVFLNGQLAQSTLVSSRTKTGSPEAQVRFSETRIGTDLDRAWVLRSCTDDNKSMATNTTGDANWVFNHAEKRWNAIQLALLSHIDVGKREKVKASPSTEYLESLAKMKIPEVLSGMKASTCLAFAVIDVVITLGLSGQLATGVAYDPPLEKLHDSTMSVRSPIITRSRTTESLVMGVKEESLTNSLSVLAGNSTSFRAPSPFIAPSGLRSTSSTINEPVEAHAPASRRSQRIEGTSSRGKPTRTRRGRYANGTDQSSPEKPQSHHMDTGFAAMPSITPGSDTWSYRSRSGAKTPVIERTLSDPHHEPSSGSTKRGKPEVIVMIPYRNNKTEEEPPAKLIRTGNSLPPAAAPSVSPSPLPRAPDARSTSVPSQPRFPDKVSIQMPIETSNVIQPVAPVESALIKATKIALENGAKPGGPLIAAIARRFKEKSPERLPQVYPNENTATTTPSTTPQHTTYTHPSAMISPPEAEFSSMRIGISNGQAAVYAVPPPYAEPIVTPATKLLHTTTAGKATFGAAASTVPLPALEMSERQRAASAARMTVASDGNDNGETNAGNSAGGDVSAIAGARGGRGRGRGRARARSTRRGGRGRGGRATTAATADLQALPPTSPLSTGKRKRRTTLETSPSTPATATATQTPEPATVAIPLAPTTFNPPPPPSSNPQTPKPSCRKSTALPPPALPTPEIYLTTAPISDHPLHDSSIIGFFDNLSPHAVKETSSPAKVGAGAEGGNAGIRGVLQPERGGSFEEKEVLLGLRFLVVRRRHVEVGMQTGEVGTETEMCVE